jgi:hypothetical protein
LASKPKTKTFFNLFSEKASATVTPLGEKTIVTQSNPQRRSAFGSIMKRFGLVQSPA